MSGGVKTKSDNEVTFLSLAVAAVVLFAIVGWFGNWSHNERGLWWAWEYKTNVLAGLANVWYIFAWAFVVTGITAILLVRERVPSLLGASAQFISGLWVSFRVSLVEEVIFRWLLVLSAPVGLTILNAITFGGFEWINVHWLLPLANWATFGILEPQLTDHNWVMAAAILYAAAAFRNVHTYLGLFGYINSWFMGMVLFYLVFNYGFMTAVVAHFVYDVIIFTLFAVSALFRPRGSALDVLWKLFRR